MISNPSTLSCFGQTVVFGTDWTAATLIDQLRRENIRLDPIFQRRDAWNAQRKSRFIESIVLGLPIPQIVLAEAKDDKGTFLVIDGKQRLLSLQQFAGIGVVPPQEPLVLKDLKFRPELNDRSYEGLKKDTKLHSNRLNAFENQPIRTVVVKNWQKEDVLYLIFHRLNSESLPLSPQELRQALHPGPFLRFAADYTLTVGGIHRVLGIIQQFRMRDVELFVRYIAFQYDLENSSGNLKKFLDDECKELNKKWLTEAAVIKEKALQMEEAIKTVYDVFGDDAFRKWDGVKYENRFNRAVFDIMTYYFANERVRKQALLKKLKVKTSFQNLSHDPAFVRSVRALQKALRQLLNDFSCGASSS